MQQTGARGRRRGRLFAYTRFMSILNQGTEPPRNRTAASYEMRSRDDKTCCLANQGENRSLPALRLRSVRNVVIENLSLLFGGEFADINDGATI
jgi:hypothetical protein